MKKDRQQQGSRWIWKSLNALAYGIYSVTIGMILCLSTKTGDRTSKIYLAPSGQTLDFSCEAGSVRFTVPKVEMCLSGSH